MKRVEVLAVFVVSLLSLSLLPGGEKLASAGGAEPAQAEMIDTLQVLRSIDGAMASDFVRKFMGGVDPFALAVDPPRSKNVVVAGPDAALRDPGFDNEPMAVLGSAAYSLAAETDNDMDGETAMSNVQLSVNGQLLDHSIVAYMKYDSSVGAQPDYRVYVRSTKTGDGFWTEWQMPLLGASYKRIVDPVLSSNAATSGVAPGRTYLVTLQDGVTGVALVPPQGLAVQVSDTGGVEVTPWVDPSTSSPATAKKIVENLDSAYYIDKPDLVVSQYSGTRGWVYLCYMKLQISPYDPYLSELYVTRSQTGGATWTTPVKVYTGRIQAPQIAHSVSFDRVYVSWVNHDTDAIQFAWSDNKGVTWSPISTSGVPETAASGPIKSGENRNLAFTSAGYSVPQMRFDHVNNQVELVWHESEYQVTGTHTGSNNSVTTLVDASANFVAAGVKVGDYVRNKSNDSYNFVTAVSATTLNLGQWFSWKPAGQRELDFDNGDAYVVKARNTDIYFTRKTATGWQPKKRLVVALGGDQFQPAIDFADQSNRLMVGYLDRSADPQNQLYQAAWILTDAAGNKISSGLVASSFSSDPQGNGTGTSFIGDYTDMWFWPYIVSAQDPWGPRWHFVFDGRRPSDGTNGDPWLSAVQQVWRKVPTRVI